MRALDIDKWRDAWRHLTGRGPYPHQFAFLLLLPLRSVILSPRALIARLGLRQDSRVLELGPGPGFFSVELARAVPRGYLCLADIQQEMLAKARRRLVRAGLANASYVRASAMDLPLRAGVFDLVLMVTVLGEVPDPGACMRALASVLRPGAVVSVTELAGDPDAMTEPQIAELARAAGLEPAATFRARGGFTVNYRKP